MKIMASLRTGMDKITMGRSFFTIWNAFGTTLIFTTTVDSSVNGGQQYLEYYDNEIRSNADI